MNPIAILQSFGIGLLLWPMFTISWLTISAQSQTKTKETRSNIILIMADDIGYECYGAYG